MDMSDPDPTLRPDPLHVDQNMILTVVDDPPCDTPDHARTFMRRAPM